MWRQALFLSAGVRSFTHLTAHPEFTAPSSCPATSAFERQTFNSNESLFARGTQTGIISRFLIKNKCSCFHGGGSRAVWLQSFPFITFSLRIWISRMYLFCASAIFSYLSQTCMSKIAFVQAWDIIRVVRHYPIMYNTKLPCASSLSQAVFSPWTIRSIIIYYLH